MNSATVEPHSWPQRRWWLLIGLIFAGQVGFIFWLSDRGPHVPRLPAAAPRLRLAGNAPSAWLALNDPTLFALPHWEGFSGPAWLNIPSLERPSPDWTEPPRWLALPLAELGATFERFIQTNRPDAEPLLARPAPGLTLPEPAPPVLASEHSSYRLEGPLAQRRLLTAPDLPAWKHADILTNSIVQLIVDAEGKPIAVALLSGSGLSAADDQALVLARGARFESLSGTEPEPAARLPGRLSWGEMIFEWHTEAPEAGAGSSGK